jgi:hypothetical protein
MDLKQIVVTAAKWSVILAAIASASYATYVILTWCRYGRMRQSGAPEADALLNRFMPVYDVADRHQVHVAAPAEVTLAAACVMDIESSAIVRGIFKTREWILNSAADKAVRPRELLAGMKSLGWGVLADQPGREIVLGGATKPWEANPNFRALPPGEFAEFCEPGFVKILWTLRADPYGSNQCIFRSETRAVATDSTARRRFRLYWAFLSPGIIAIRRALLPKVKSAAERRWRLQLVA